LACFGAAVGGDDENLGFRRPLGDQANPLLHKPLLGPLAGLPHHQIDGWGAEEELVGGSIYPLPAEIPAVERDLLAGGLINNPQGLDFNAMGGGPVAIPWITPQRGQ
jgi:hypothetical protein